MRRIEAGKLCTVDAWPRPDIIWIEDACASARYDHGAACGPCGMLEAILIDSYDGASSYQPKAHRSHESAFDLFVSFSCQVDPIEDWAPDDQARIQDLFDGFGVVTRCSGRGLIGSHVGYEWA